MKSIFPKRDRPTPAGFALPMVLALIVLMTGLVVAFLSQGIAEKIQSSSNVHQMRADILAQSGLEMVVADLGKEISDPANSTNSPSGPYTPKLPKDILPARSGHPVSPPGEELIPNLVRRSVRDDTLAVPSRASAISSEGDASLNQRRVSKARWNAHYLIPRDPAISASTIHTEPIPEFIAPDWVMVTQTGPEVLTTPDQATIGRYAYAVYDEGGLLDINVAGYPFRQTGNTLGLRLRDVGRKGGLPFANVTVPNLLSKSAISDIIGWRNFATVQPKKEFANYDFDDPDGAGPNTATRFLAHVQNNPTRFLTVSSISTPPTPPAVFHRTDQIFTSRQSLLALRRAIAFSQDALRHLGTFSRGRNRPTWKDAEKRLDRRFPLSRFDLFTNPIVNGAYSPTPNNRKPIQRYFGLIYVPAAGPIPEHWEYYGANGDTKQSSIHVLNGDGQDPDLSVLLRWTLPPAISDAEILSTMASLIDLRDANQITTWIEYESGGSPSIPLKAFGADETPSSDPNAPASPPLKDFGEAFRSSGEIGCALKNGTTSINFSTTGDEAVLLDLFTANQDLPELQAGLVNLNTRNPVVLAALITGAYETTPKWESIQSSDYVGPTNGTNASKEIANATATKPALSRVEIAELISKVGTSIGSSEDQRELVARALTDATQTRTWNLMIDLVAQSGRYPPTATASSDLAKFVVEGEKRYWLHIAIDRFTGKVIDQQLEAVYE